MGLRKANFFFIIFSYRMGPENGLEDRTESTFYPNTNLHYGQSPDGMNQIQFFAASPSDFFGNTQDLYQ